MKIVIAAAVFQFLYRSHHHLRPPTLTTPPSPSRVIKVTGRRICEMKSRAPTFSERAFQEEIGDLPACCNGVNGFHKLPNYSNMFRCMLQD